MLEIYKGDPLNKTVYIHHLHSLFRKLLKSHISDICHIVLLFSPGVAYYLC